MKFLLFHCYAMNFWFWWISKKEISKKYVEFWNENNNVRSFNRLIWYENLQINYSFFRIHNLSKIKNRTHCIVKNTENLNSLYTCKTSKSNRTRDSNIKLISKFKFWQNFIKQFNVLFINDNDSLFLIITTFKFL